MYFLNSMFSEKHVRIFKNDFAFNSLNFTMNYLYCCQHVKHGYEFRILILRCNTYRFILISYDYILPRCFHLTIGFVFEPVPFFTRPAFGFQTTPSRTVLLMSVPVFAA